MEFALDKTLIGFNGDTRHIFWTIQNIILQNPSSENNPVSSDVYFLLLSNGWFWITLILVLALLSLGGYTLWLHGLLRASKATSPSENPGKPGQEQPPVQEKPTDQEQPSTDLQKTTDSVSALTSHTPKDHSMALVGGEPHSCSNDCLMCLNCQPSPPHDSTYQPLKRFNSFRSAHAYTTRDRQAQMIMRDTTKCLNDMQVQLQRMKEFETYDNDLRMPAQPMSEYEQRTGWIFKNGWMIFPEDPSQNYQVAPQSYLVAPQNQQGASRYYQGASLTHQGASRNNQGNPLNLAAIQNNQGVSLTHQGASGNNQGTPLNLATIQNNQAAPQNNQGASLAHQGAALNLATRPPIPPPVRHSSLPRQEKAIPMQERNNIIVPVELH